MRFPGEDSSLICENCRGDRVYIDTNTGEYYCEDCGIQQQEIRELERDIDDVYFETSNVSEGRKSNIRRASQSTEKLSNEENNLKNLKDDDSLFIHDSKNISNKKQTYFDKWVNKKPKIVKNYDFLIGVQLIIQNVIKDMIERRQVKNEVLKTSKSIWFLFMEYLYKNNIPIRAFFADLRCSILKVPFNETATNSLNITKTYTEKFKSPNIRKIDHGSERILLYELLYNIFGLNRVEYLSNICSRIIKYSNSTNIRGRMGSKTLINKTCENLLEEWEISARKLQLLANERNIPYTNWFGESIIPRSELIKSVIDMIYEYDFLESYFNRIRDSILDKNEHIDQFKFDDWINFHVNFFSNNKKINQYFLLITNYLELPKNQFQNRKDLEFQLHKVHTTHLLLNRILGKRLSKVFNNSSLSNYSPMFVLNENIESQESGKRKLFKVKLTNTIIECPKIDYCFILCIIWISLLKSGYQVTSFDIIEWVKLGKIDIFKSEKLIPKWLKDAGFKWDNDINSCTNTRSVTQISRIPSPADLEKVISFFSLSIKVVIPPVNIPILIHRILANCSLLGHRGGNAIQPLCIRLWEFLSKEDGISKLFGKLTIAPSIIIVIARSIWPIFVYHCIPNPKSKIENGQKDTELLKSNTSVKFESFNLDFRFNKKLSSWVIKTGKTQFLSKQITRFYSTLHGIEWSGIFAINWLYNYLTTNLSVCPIKVKSIFENSSANNSELIIEKKGRPSMNFRGNFFNSIRKKRQGIKKKFGRNNWSGIVPSELKYYEFYSFDKKKISVFSKYLPSNREIFHSVLFNINIANLLSDNGMFQLWDSLDNIERVQLINNWEKILLTSKETENSSIIKGVVKDNSPSALCSRFPLLIDQSFLKIEGKCFSNIGPLVDHIFNLKLELLKQLFQDPGIFTSIVLPLPQFIHSKQMFTNSEASLPAPYSILLLQLTKITGENYLNIHNCVIKIEEMLREKLKKKNMAPYFNMTDAMPFQAPYL